MSRQEYEDQTNGTRDEETIRRLLCAAGHRPQLPKQIEENWSETFKGELNQVIARRRRWRLTGVGALCATLLIALFFAGSMLNKPSELLVPVAHITKISGASVAIAPDYTVSSLSPGSDIYPATILETPKGAYLGLNFSGIDLRLNERTRIRISRTEIELIEGQLYVDSHSGDSEQKDPMSVTVRTKLATIRDIGTQFTVSTFTNGTVAEVREGIIAVSVGSREYRAQAESDHAQRLSVSRMRDINLTKTSKYGAAWDWVLPLAPSFTIEGRTAYDFLVWATRESGLTLYFTEPRAQSNARSTILHGDVSSLPPDKAIDAVLATTRLVVDRTDQGALRVSLQN